MGTQKGDESPVDSDDQDSAASHLWLRLSEELPSLRAGSWEYAHSSEKQLVVRVGGNLAPDA